MRIGYLCDHPRHLASLARAHVEAFGGLLPKWTQAEAAAELESHRERRAVPTTLVALERGQWLGSASLLQNDHEDIRQYSPWLASLYVRPEARGRQLGAALVGHCVAEAGALGIACLFLYCTEDLCPWYRRLGWSEHDRIQLGPLRVVVMAIDCATETMQ